MEPVGESFLAQPGQCWRFTREADPGKLGRMTACKQSVRWAGQVRLSTGERVAVCSCDEHRDRLERLRRVD